MNSHRAGSPTQSKTPHQNIRMGVHIPGCIHNTPTTNHTNERYPLQLPLSSTAHWTNLLPLYITHTTPTDLQTNFPTGIDVIIASLLTYPPTTRKDTSKIRPQELALMHIIRLVHYLYTSQPHHIGYMLANTPSPSKHHSIQEELGHIITLDGPPLQLRSLKRNTDMPKPSPQ